MTDSNGFNELTDDRVRDIVLALLENLGGGNDPVFYKAAGEVNESGAVDVIKGATVTRVAVGRYDVVFTSPMASAAYPVLLTPEGKPQRDDYFLDYFNKTANGFQVRGTEQDNGGTAGIFRDMSFSFFVPVV